MILMPDSYGSTRQPDFEARLRDRGAGVFERVSVEICGLACSQGSLMLDDLKKKKGL